MFRLCMIMLVSNFIWAADIISSFTYSHTSNKTDLTFSWRVNSSRTYSFAKVFICNSSECVESSSGEFRVNRSVFNQSLLFSRSFFGQGELSVLVKGINNTTGSLDTIYTKDIKLACDRELYKVDLSKLSGPIDLNCDGSVDVLEGPVRVENLAKVYPFVSTIENDEEVSFSKDGQFIIDNNANANFFNSQSCKVKVVTKNYFNDEARVKFIGRYSRSDDSLYEIPTDFTISQADCKNKDGQGYCSKEFDLCSSRPSYFNPSKKLKGYDNRAYRVEIDGLRFGSYHNKCSVNYYRYDDFTFVPGQKDGLDNDCSGEVDEEKSFSNYCSKVDPTGARDICKSRCETASSEHLVRVFRFPKLCSAYNGRYPLWSSSTRRLEKLVCKSSSKDSDHSFDEAVAKCDTCSKRINKTPSSWRDRRIEDSCSNYSSVKGFKSRAAYTVFSADYENCSARVKCDRWKDSTATDSIFY